MLFIEICNSALPNIKRERSIYKNISQAGLASMISGSTFDLFEIYKTSVLRHATPANLQQFLSVWLHVYMVLAGHVVLHLQQ